MSLPTRNDLLTMGFSYMGEPFVQVVSKSTISTDGLGYSYMGEPFTAAGINATFKIYIGSNQITAMYIGSNLVTTAYLGTNVLM